MNCPHVRTTKLITKDATHERCDDCGAVRSDPGNPHIKEGQTLAFRSADWVPGLRLGPPQVLQADGVATLRELVEMLAREKPE